MSTNLDVSLNADWDKQVFFDFDKLHYLVFLYVHTEDGIKKLCQDLCYVAKCRLCEQDQHEKVQLLDQLHFYESEESLMHLLHVFQAFHIELEEVLLAYPQCLAGEDHGQLFYEHANKLVKHMIQEDFPIVRVRYH